MIEFLFTIDYEIYGNGDGTLAELVYEPACRLLELFRKRGATLVFFVEPLEFEKIEAFSSDGGIVSVLAQIKAAYAQGFEIGLHLHPQWFNAVFANGHWLLDNAEYNLCTLPEDRIAKIVTHSIGYLRSVLGDAAYSPLSFRAGNWLFQPSTVATRVLSGLGVRFDSSVFKGGVQHAHGLDYRAAPVKDYFWCFKDDVVKAVPDGLMIEVPIYTELVPSWKMVTGKRLKFQSKMTSSAASFNQRLNRLRDRIRLRYPLKLDFCRMTLAEMISMMDRIRLADLKDPNSYKPIVAIGHTKDLVDFETIARFLDYLQVHQIAITDFPGLLTRLASPATLAGCAR